MEKIDIEEFVPGTFLGNDIYQFTGDENKIKYLAEKINEIIDKLEEISPTLT